MSTSHVQYRLKTYPFLKSFAPQTVGTQWTGLIDFGPCTNRFLILQFFHTLPLDEIKDVQYINIVLWPSVFIVCYALLHHSGIILYRNKHCTAL